jgi:hypothetical protein
LFLLHKSPKTCKCVPKPQRLINTPNLNFSFLKSYITFFIILLFCFSLFTTYLNAQVQQKWVRLYPENIPSFQAGSNAMVLDSFGNVYITGHAESNPNGSWTAFCTVKYNSSGEQQWASFYYGNNNGGRYSFAIDLDKLNNIYVTGYSYNSGSLFDYCTVKYDSNGVQQWVRQYDGSAHSFDEAHKLTVDNAGNICIGIQPQYIRVCIYYN